MYSHHSRWEYWLNKYFMCNIVIFKNIVGMWFAIWFENKLDSAEWCAMTRRKCALCHVCVLFTGAAIVVLVGGLKQTQDWYLGDCHLFPLLWNQRLRDVMMLCEVTRCQVALLHKPYQSPLVSKYLSERHNMMLWGTFMWVDEYIEIHCFAVYFFCTFSYKEEKMYTVTLS